MKGFTTRKVLISKDGTKPMIICKAKHFEWNNADMVYYYDESDEDAYMEKPKNGEKTYCLKNGYKARLLVKVDR